MGLGLYAGGLASQLAAERSLPRCGARRPDSRTGGFEDYLARATAAASPSQPESSRAAERPTATPSTHLRPDDPHESQGDETPPADEAVGPVPFLLADQAAVEDPATVQGDSPPVLTTRAFTTLIESDSTVQVNGPANAGVSADRADAAVASAEQPALPPVDPTAGLTPDLPVRKAGSDHNAAIQPEGEVRLLVPPPAENQERAATPRLAYLPGRFEEEPSSVAQLPPAGDGEPTSQLPGAILTPNAKNSTQTLGMLLSGGDDASVPPSLSQAAALPKAAPHPVEMESPQPSAQERKARRILEQAPTRATDESTNEQAAAARPSFAVGRRNPEHFTVLQGTDREGERARSDAVMLRTLPEAKAGDSSADGDRLSSRSFAPLGSTASTRAADAAATSGARLGSIAMQLGEAIAAEIAGPDGPAQAARVVAASGGGHRFQLAMRLEPPELGALRLQLQMQGMALNLRVEAESGSVARLIESRLSHLRETLAAHGIQIERTDIVVRSSGSQEAAWQQHGGSQGEESRGGSAGSPSEQLAGDSDHNHSAAHEGEGNPQRSKAPSSEGPDRRSWMPNVTAPTSVDAMTESLLDLVA